MNSSGIFPADIVARLSHSTPFYYSDRPQLLPFVTDVHLSVLIPIVAHWCVALVFHFLDTRSWRILDKYRIHDSEETKSRNLVTKTEVIRAVLLQQAVQTLLGLWWMSDAHRNTDHVGSMLVLGKRMMPVLAILLGEQTAVDLMQTRGAEVVAFMYWWAIPAFQLFFAMFVLDTWEYFWHRLFHVNKFLYKHIHSVHHRLYVPYAFGALYNHPLEGFILDSLGAAVSEACSFMTTRQAMVIFALATCKTVDDHCGYRLPFDPLQFFFTNTADYHDIHHQVIGIKSNFSQPWFVHWDALLGTRMTRGDLEKRKYRSRGKVEKSE